MSNGRKIAYSFGSFGSSLLANAFSTYIVFYYVDVLKVPTLLITNGMVAYGIWNAINDPLFGYLSDRTHSRWGRRIPYVAFGMVPLALMFALVWTPFAKVDPANYFPIMAYFLVAIFFWDGLYTMVFLNYTALFPEMYTGLAERSRVSAWRQVFGILGMILGIALAPLVYGAVGWAGMGVIFALTATVSVLVSLWGSKENPAFGEKQSLNIVSALKYTLANRSFLTYVLSSLAVQFTFVMLMAAIPFYAKYVLHIAKDQQSVMLLGTFAVTLAMLFFWNRVTVRIGARQTMIAAIIVFGVTLIAFWFASDFITGAIAAALMGLGLAGLMLLLDVLISDVIDEDETRTGVRREGMYFGVNALFIRLGISLQAFAMGRILTAYGYDPKLEVQPASAEIGLRVVMTAVPIISLVIALAFIWAYPLHGRRLKEVKTSLAKLRPGDGVAD